MYLEIEFYAVHFLFILAATLTSISKLSSLRGRWVGKTGTSFTYGVLVITPSHSQTTGDVALDLASPGGKEACNLPALNWYTRGAKIPRIQLALDLGLVNW